MSKVNHGTPWPRRNLNAWNRKVEGACAMAFAPHPFLNFLRALLRRP